MAISRHTEEFDGLPIFDFAAAPEPTAPGSARALPTGGAVSWRLGIGIDAEDTFALRWRSFLDTVQCGEARALVIGPWWAEEIAPLREALAELVGSAERLPALRALFLGDVTSEECELSWLQMADITSVLEAFPGLETLVVRGASGDWNGKDGLALRPVRHEHLRTLRFEAAGLPGAMVRAIGACELPALERLDLWLGVAANGGDTTVPDLAPILADGAFPSLRRLGLENSEIQDELAEALAHAPVVARLERLSLALGTLTDRGAAALLAGRPLTHLGSLDLHHHFIGDGLLRHLRDTVGAAGVELDISDQQDEDGDWPYVAHAE